MYSNSKVFQFFYGLAFGVAPYVLVISVFFLVMPSRIVGGEALYYVYFVLPVFGLVSLVVIVVCHWWSYRYLKKMEHDFAAVSVWLIYPMVFLLFIANELAELAVSMRDYAGREIFTPEREVKQILFEAGEKTRLARDFFDRHGCGRNCISTLKSGAVESISISVRSVGNVDSRARIDDDKFVVFRVEGGSRCDTVRQNLEDFREVAKKQHELLYQPAKIDKNRDKKQQLDEAMARREENSRKYDKVASKTFIQPTADRLLETSGYFGECITWSLSESPQHDIKIVVGKKAKRLFGPCCNVAEILEKRERGYRLLARWEGGHGKRFAGKYFTIPDIISKLTSTSIDTRRTGHGGLPHREIESVEKELERISRIVQAGTASYRNHYMVQWIQYVLRQDARANERPRARLSGVSVEMLLRIAPMDYVVNRKNYIARIEDVIDEESRKFLFDADPVPRPGSEPIQNGAKIKP